MKIVDCDYFVVGSGMSGLMTALHLATAGRVVLATKQRLEDCNTNFAQGGICCVADPADTFAAHVQDTLIAGAGLCDEKVVRRIVSEAPAGIRDLIDCGVRFAKKEDGSWDLGREGGHSMRRIFHAGDITGQKCEAAMIRTTPSAATLHCYNRDFYFPVVKEDKDRPASWDGHVRDWADREIEFDFSC